MSVTKGEWFLKHAAAVDGVRAARKALDDLAYVTELEGADEKVCFAGSTLEGAAALLREAAAVALRGFGPSAVPPRPRSLPVCSGCGWIFGHDDGCTVDLPKTG
jgi:hypothetical protein